MKRSTPRTNPRAAAPQPRGRAMASPSIDVHTGIEGTPGGLRRARRQEDGASAVEYSLLVGLIAAVILGTVRTLGQTVMGTFVLPWP